jgi:5'-nucleotidase / UDP-sugar diphosphatase
VVADTRVLLPLLLLSLLACPREAPVEGASQPASPAPGGSGSLVLLHTNDIHCHYLPTPARWLEGSPAIGGFEALGSYLETVRAREPALLVLDAGDILSGTPLSELEVDGMKGAEMTGFLGDWGYDAWVVGNHEFDQGYDTIAALVASAPVPPLCANLQAPGGGPAMPGLEASRIFDRGGLQVGVIGITTPDLQRLVSADTWSRLELLDEVDAIKAEVDRLDPQTDLLVLLSHSGLETDLWLAAKVPGLDLIVGGHSHDATREPELVGGTYVVQAGSYARSVGRLDISVADDVITSLEGRLVNLQPEPTWAPATPAVLERLERVTAAVDAAYGRVVGVANAPVQRDSYRQGSLGLWVTSLMLEATGADVAFYNSGGLRADLPAGELTYADLYQVLPFGNAPVTFSMTGTELMKIVKRNAFSEATRETSSLQCAGLAWSWRPGAGGQEVVSVTVGGQALEPERSYTVATNSYVASHIGEILDLPEREIQLHGASIISLVERALQAGPLEPPPARRTQVE